MECISHVHLSQLSTEEIGLLIKLLSDTNNLSAGDMEQVISMVVAQLQKTCVDDGEPGETFRKKS